MESENKTYTLAITHNPPADFELTGVAARDLSFLASANLDIVPSFVITGHSFDLYLEHNGIVPELVEQINLAAEYPKQTKKVANAIRDLFRSGTFPTSLKLEIAKEYESISKGKDPLVNLSQSPLNIDLDERSFLEKRGEWLNVQGEEEILKAVREVWASLFSKEALDYRNSVNYEGSLSQPVLVQKMLNADLSGQTYNFDTNTGVEHVSTSRVNLGISLEPSLASKDADYYSVKKANAEAVAVVNLPQKFMQVRSQHSGETTKVKVSKAWSERRKLDEGQISKLNAVLGRIEANLSGKFMFEWIYDSGSFIITRLQPFSEELAKKLPEIKWGGKNASLAQELSAEVGGGGSGAAGNEDVLNSFDGRGDSTGFSGVGVSSAGNNLSSNDSSSELEIITKNEAMSKLMDDNGKESKAKDVKEMVPEIKTVTEIWWDVELPAHEIKVFQNNLDGFGVFSMASICKTLDLDGGNLGSSQAAQKKICEYLAIYLVGAAPTPVFIELSRELEFEAQVEVLSQLRKLYGHKNFWVLLPSLRNIDEIARFKKTLSGYNFRRTNLFRVFQLIDQPLLLANIELLAEQAIDGVFIDLDSLYKNALGQEVYELLEQKAPLGKNYELMQNFLIENLIDKSETKLFTYIRTRNSKLLDKMLEELVENGVNGIVYPEKDLFDFKQKLTELESQLLTKSLKKIKKGLRP